jgi:hypothetical protein
LLSIFQSLLTYSSFLYHFINFWIITSHHTICILVFSIISFAFIIYWNNVALNKNYKSCIQGTLLRLCQFIFLNNWSRSVFSITCKRKLGTSIQLWKMMLTFSMSLWETGVITWMQSSEISTALIKPKHQLNIRKVTRN